MEDYGYNTENIVLEKCLDCENDQCDGSEWCEGSSYKGSSYYKSNADEEWMVNEEIKNDTGGVKDSYSINWNWKNWNWNLKNEDDMM